jgi:ubiquinone/menaquinone biosynthesis C-methylase UbiE
MTNEILKKRHRAEKDFHNQKYAGEKKQSIYDLGFIDLIFERMVKLTGDMKNKKVVDFGCGNGWLTEILLQNGAEVWAFDISKEAIRLTEAVAQKNGHSNRLHTGVMPAEQLEYDDNFFDVVIGVAILHHLDIEIAAKEIFRVLKPGGTAYFMEPLAYNPFINLYRKKTPDIRSVDEKPLGSEDFMILKRIFNEFKYENYYFLTLFSLFWYYVIKNDRLFCQSRNVLFKIDELILKHANWIKKYCWYSILQMKK